MLKTWMKQDIMKLNAILSKFHIEHAQNGATVQHIHSKQDITTICPKQQLGTLQSSNNMLQESYEHKLDMHFLYR